MKKVPKVPEKNKYKIEKNTIFFFKFEKKSTKKIFSLRTWFYKNDPKKYQIFFLTQNVKKLI